MLFNQALFDACTSQSLLSGGANLPPPITFSIVLSKFLIIDQIFGTKFLYILSKNLKSYVVYQKFSVV